jgi:tetratricopeptide (TPR) repeat protein
MQPGQLYADRFAVERLANRGGMGTVYRAIDRETGAPVALKVLQGCSEQAAALFAREARILAELCHPGIVEYVAHGRTDDDSLWLCMEWLQGEDLERRIRRGPVSVRDTLALGRSTAEALGAAHAAGIVHRDIKPSNLLIVGHDLARTKIVDFGIARSRQATRPATRTGNLLGTPGYMSPEQMVGDKDLDQTADVFALGCVLYECLTGQAAFEGEHVMVVLAKILIGETPRVRERRREVPEALDALIARMMSKDRSRRPRDGAAVVLEIAVIEEALGRATLPSGPASEEPASSARGSAFAGPFEAMAALLEGEASPPSGPPVGLEATPLLGAPPRFFGRKRELRILEAFYGECVFSSCASVALVTGPPGIGKSSLCREFLEQLHESGQPVEVWLGKGRPMLRGSPFSLLSGAIRGASGIDGGEPLQARQQKLWRRIGRHLPQADVERVASYIGQMVGIPCSGAPDLPLRAALQDARLMGAQIRRAFEDWLAAECAAGPLLLVLEDLSWGDGASVALITAALRYLGKSPLLVIATGPAEVRGAFPELFPERATKEVALAELSREESEAEVRAVLEPLGLASSDESVTQIAARAEGNPLLLSELIRAVAELREGAHPQEPTEARAAIDESIEFLPDEARRILSAASVFGDVFSETHVLSILEDTPVSTEHRSWLAGRHWLSVLIEHELIVQCGGHGAEARATYTFRHDLMREVVYAALPPLERATLHRRAGERLERAGEGEPGALARHFEHAGEATRAVGWCVLCAERSLEGDDAFGILAWAERSILLGASGQLLGAVRLVSAEAYKRRGDHAAALAAALAAMQDLPFGSAHWYSAVGQAALASGKLGDHESLVQVFHQLRAAGQAKHGDGGGAPYAIALSRVALQLLEAGQDELSAIAFDELAVVDDDVILRDPEVYASIHRARAMRGRNEGDPAGSLVSFTAAAQAFEQVGDLLNACVQQVNVGGVNIELGSYADAERALRAALTRTDRLGLMSLAAFARHNLGLALARLGYLPEAHLVETQAIEAYTKQGDRRLEGGSKIYLAMILALQGELAEAAQQAEEAVEVVATHPSVRAFALAALGQIWMQQGRAVDAMRAGEEAMRLLEDLGGIDEGEALVRLVHAEALGQAGFAQIARVAIVAARDRLLARADKITAPALRTSFLERVPENARTLSLAHQWAEDLP